MGNCCYTSSVSSNAFRQNDLRTSLVQDYENFPADTQVLVLLLSGIKNLPKADPSYGRANSYVEMKLIQAGPSSIKHVQEQTSAIKPNTLCPTWTPAEKFQFFVTVPKSKVLISIYHYNASDPNKPDVLGDTVLNLATLKLSETPQVLNLKQILDPANGMAITGYSNTDTGKKGATMLEVLASIHPLHSDALTHSQSFYEFERWVGDWGSSELHMMLEMNQRYCTNDGKVWCGSFEEISQQEALAMPEGWCIHEDWHTIGNDEDIHGYEYSSELTAPFWYPSQIHSLLVVRRRMFRRDLKKKEKRIINAIKQSVRRQSSLRPAPAARKSSVTSSSSSTYSPPLKQTASGAIRLSVIEKSGSFPSPGTSNNTSTSNSSTNSTSGQDTIETGVPHRRQRRFANK